MFKVALSLFLFATVKVWAVPQHAPWPGGIAIIELGESASSPTVHVAGVQALVMRDSDHWVGVVGIPLDTKTDDPLLVDIERPGQETETVSIEIQPADYRVQRLTVDRKYVEPDPQSLERIFAERKTIDSALSSRRDVALDDLSLRPPVPGNRSNSFGSRRIFNDQPRSPHKGMDLSGSAGTPILAPRDGVVSVVGDFYFNGNTVILDHGQGFVSLYCHLSAIDVAQGQVVQTGEALGKVGATGRVTGAHLHFATYLNATAVDPALLLTDD